MRPRFLISILFFALVILALLLWLRPAKPPVVHTPTPVQRAPSTTPQTSLRPINPTAIIAQSNANPGKTYNNAIGNDEESRIKKAAERNVPVEFYGLVIDQDSNVLSGVQVKLGVRHNILILNSEDAAKYAGLSADEQQKALNPTTEVVSGGDGRFQWIDSNVTGDIMGVGTLQKEGYEPEPGQYSCGAGVGSYDNPVVFKMWSTNIHEKLITGNKTFEVVPDGRPYFINLTDGTISEHGNGDLKVWIQYRNQITQGKSYDWSAEIDVVNGGLLEVPQAAMNSGFLPDPPFAMYLAPTEGYIPSFNMKNKIIGGQNGEIGNRYFYLLLENGKKYGRISINLFAPYGHLHPGLVQLAYAINPSGSRILR